jgi:enoyl-CoA hydratase/carnithine racemase
MDSGFRRSDGLSEFLRIHQVLILSNSPLKQYGGKMVAMTDRVCLENQGDVAVISIDNPPVNALSYGIRKGIADGIQAAVDDASIKAIVLICQGRTFVAGTDITEFGKPPQNPEVNAIDPAKDKPKIFTNFCKSISHFLYNMLPFGIDTVSLHWS